MAFQEVYHLIHDLKDWGSFLVALASLLSALAAFITIHYLKKQMRSSYKPHIYLDNKASYTIKLSKGSFALHDLGSDDKEELYQIHYSIENIGLESAKKVKIEWDFDIKKAYKLIRKKTNHPLAFEGHDSYINIFDQNDKKNIIDLHNNAIDNIAEYDFILPRRDERFNKSPGIDNEIIKAFTAYFLIKHGIFHMTAPPIIIHEEFKDFPQLSVKVTYEDIGGKKYKKKFDVDLAISTGVYTLKDMIVNRKFDLTLFLNFEEK